MLWIDNSRSTNKLRELCFQKNAIAPKKNRIQRTSNLTSSDTEHIIDVLTEVEGRNEDLLLMEIISASKF